MPQAFLPLVEREIILDQNEIGRGNKGEKIRYLSRTRKAEKLDQRNEKSARRI